MGDSGDMSDGSPLRSNPFVDRDLFKTGPSGAPIRKGDGVFSLGIRFSNFGTSFASIDPMVDPF